MRQEYSAGSAGFILGSLPRCTTQCHQTRSYPAPAAPAPEDEEALEARVDEALAGNQELQSYVQLLDSGLVDADQEPPDEMKPPRSKLRGITRKSIICETPRFLKLFPLQGNPGASSEESPD